MRFRALSLAIAAAVVPAVAAAQTAPTPSEDIASRVEIRRTAYGVPHIKAEDLRAAAYGLAWVQLEDHGPRVAMGILRSRGEMGRWFGRDSMESDFFAQRERALAVEKYVQLDQATRDVYDGFAAGVNRYVEVNPSEFPPGFAPRFTGYDIAARDIGGAGGNSAQAFLRRILPPDPRRQPGTAAPGEGAPGSLNRRDSGGRELNRPEAGRELDLDVGSNAWAFAPSRTKSGRAILVRNPHLQWTAGYYEAHLTVPDVVDFYGDFRIGGPFGVIGGFNKDLGWATTNNAPDLDEIYALDVDPNGVDRYLFDGESLALVRELVTVVFRNGDGLSSETREFWRTSLGPVIHRGDGRIYVIRSAGQDDFRGGEQFLRMMRAKNLAEWKDAMRMRARVTSNFTYADRAGNIFYVWNASIPALPHASGADTTAIPARKMSDVWTRYVPFDSLPQLLNPKGGYVRNENDPPYHTNLRQVLDRAAYPANFPEPALSLRSQHSLTLIDNNRKMSLEEIMALKHSYRMLMADRVKADLVAAVRERLVANGTAAVPADSAVMNAIALIETWDNTAAPASRGALLFETWARRFAQGTSWDSLYAERWDPARPLATPRGLRDRSRAADAFIWAVGESARRFGTYDVAWGDVHRVRIGTVDVPVGGCAGALGCFRVLNFRNEPDGKRAASGGDGWVIGVEFTDVPKAYSILAYGQSPREDSPYHSDQAAMFARGEMKRVLFTEADIEKGTDKRYRPGAR